MVEIKKGNLIAQTNALLADLKLLSSIGLQGAREVTKNFDSSSILEHHCERIASKWRELKQEKEQN